MGLHKYLEKLKQKLGRDQGAEAADVLESDVAEQPAAEPVEDSEEPSEAEEVDTESPEEAAEDAASQEEKAANEDSEAEADE